MDCGTDESAETDFHAAEAIELLSDCGGKAEDAQWDMASSWPACQLAAVDSSVSSALKFAAIDCTVVRSVADKKSAPRGFSQNQGVPFPSNRDQQCRLAFWSLWQVSLASGACFSPPCRFTLKFASQLKYSMKACHGMCSACHSRRFIMQLTLALSTTNIGANCTLLARNVP